MYKRQLQERLQPSLLDRLTDDEPHNEQESRSRRVLTLERLRAAVLRDLRWLFNADNAESAVDLAPYPEAARSVLNFGMPNFSGRTATSLTPSEVERRVRQAVTTFEPRILPGTLRVVVHVDEEEMSKKVLTFDIHGELWAQPLPLELYVRTEVDLESGGVTLTEDRHGPSTA